MDTDRVTMDILRKVADIESDRIVEQAQAFLDTFDAGLHKAMGIDMISHSCVIFCCHLIKILKAQKDLMKDLEYIYKIHKPEDRQNECL